MHKLIQTSHIVVLVLLLSACGASNPTKPESPKPVAGKQENAVSADEAKPNTASPPAQASSPKPGGYYLDDGPGDNPPADIDSIPDAVPHAEPLLVRANKPYYALNNSYQPMTEYIPYKKRGLASWYGKRYHGQKTSTGEIYDMYAMTGAHTILPIPSYARVTNPANKKSVVVRINDRGPFHSDRLIDLSYAAAYKLGLVAKGSGIVDVEAIDTRGMATAEATPPAVVDNTNAADAPIIKPITTPASSNPSTVTTVSAEPLAEPVATQPADTKGVFIQMGVFKVKANGDALAEKLLKANLVGNTPINNWYNDDTYRVRIGPFANRADAERSAAKIKASLKLKTYIINQP